MAESKIHPPSASRIAEARSAGLAPRPVLVGLAGALAALTGYLLLQGRALNAGLLSLVRAPLSAFAEGDAARPLEVSLTVLRDLAFQGALLAVALFAGCALALFVAQGPSVGWPRTGRTRFDEPKPVHGLTLLSGMILVLLGGSLLRDVLWVDAARFGDLMPRLLTRLSLALAALGIIDACFARASFFRALWLTRREQRAELREAYGAPELRAGRERARRVQRGGDPA